MCLRGPVSGSSSRVAYQPHAAGDAASGDRQPPSAIRGRAARGSSVRVDYSSRRSVLAGFGGGSIGCESGSMRSRMAVDWIERDADHIEAALPIAETAPDTVWRMWTEPDELVGWWPDAAEVDAM